MHRLLDNRNVLGVLFLLPAGLLLVLFLTYPLGLGTWLGLKRVKRDASRLTQAVRPAARG